MYQLERFVALSSSTEIYFWRFAIYSG